MQARFRAKGNVAWATTRDSFPLIIKERGEEDRRELLTERIGESWDGKLIPWSSFRIPFSGGWRKNYPWMIRFIARQKNMIRSKMICWMSIRRATEFNRLINFFKDRQRVWIIDKSGEEAANVYSLFAWRRGEDEKSWSSSLARGKLFRIKKLFNNCWRLNRFFTPTCFLLPACNGRWFPWVN